MLKKLLGIFISSALLAFGSMYMIKSVQSNDVLKTMLWEFVGPFLYLMFNHFMIEAPNFKTRLKLTTANAIGFSAGAAIGLFFYNNFLLFR